MATLIDQVQALLSPLVSGRCCYQINTVQPPVYPYITWFRVVSDPNVSLTGPSDLQNTHVQINIYSLSVAEMDAIGRAVDAAFAAWSVTNVPLISPSDLFETDVRAYRVIKEFSVWSKD